MKIKCPFMAHTVHYLPDGTQLYCVYEQLEDDGAPNDYYVELDELIRFIVKMAGWSHL